MKLTTLIISLTLALLPGSSSSQSLRRNNNKVAERQLNEDTYIFNQLSDGYAQGSGDKVGTSCSTSDTYASFTDGGNDPDYINIVTSKWHSGGYRMDCKDKGAHTGWQCAATCSPFPNPNFMDWTHLTFEARVLNIDALDQAGGCKPTIGITKRWPSYHSNVIAMEGDYVDTGSLHNSEWRKVVIPISDLATAEWPTVNGVKDMYFRSCGTAFSVNPHYQIRAILLTDTPPSISAGATTPNPTDQPTDNPTTAEPSPSPSDAPSPAPTEAYWSIWEHVADSTTPEDTSLPCFENEARLGITSTSDEFGDYFTSKGDAWVSGGIKFGCQQKDSNWNCIASCFDVQDWSDKLYLTFLAKVEGTSPGCTPSVTVTGGGWPRHSSQKIYLEGSYVDAGTLVSTEFRRVVIPLDDFKTEEWPGLNAMYGMYFQTCGFDEEGGSYPLLTYHIGSVAITNEAIDVVSMPPTGNPTPFVSDDILLATHRFVHTNWYPLFSPDREPDGNLWYVADNNMWPDVGSASPHTATVHIPQGQSVVYSGSDDVKLDKIIVEGSLIIQPDGSDVKLTVGTIIVEEGGTLDILTSDADSFTVTIEIDGTLDHSTDPEEIMVGILALGGSLTIKGNYVSMKMAPLSQTALAGSSTLDITGHDYDVGDELVLPDTQEELDVGHYNFPNNEDYQDQTEHCIIASVVGSEIVCESPLAYDHSAGSNAAYASRSIVIKTSQSSTDRAHILHTAGGKFEVRNARLEDLGRTTTELIDSTVFELDETLKFHPNVAKMDVISQGTNQIARYALHAHHSLVEAYFTGNAVISSPRDGMVAHNSRVHMLDNVIVDADGTGIFLEDATETGPVMNNYIIGTGGGSRGGDDGRFSSQLGKDMAHGGFGIWARGKLALIQDNHCEGHFGVSPYAFFVHPNFIKEKKVPDVPGTPAELVGVRLKNINPSNTNGLQLQSYGGFVNNTAIATFKVGIDLSYFGVSEDDTIGSIIDGADIVNLAASGRGISTTHSRLFTLNDVTLKGGTTGIWCNNCNGCHLETPNTTLVIDDVDVVRGGNC